MAALDSVETMSLPEKQAAEAKRRGPPRLEVALLLGIAVIMTAFTVAFFYFGADVSELRTYGYAGLFLINLLGAASILLPSPAAASVFGGGAFLHDFLGIPAFFWVGLVAGLGETIGEFTGYAAGYGGRVIVQDRPEYARVHRWMERHGVITMFVMSVIPNPLFDLAGVAAGAVQMPVGRFFVTVLVGKVIKDWYMAALGELGIRLVGL
ncbi:MAG: VTT domain-containing protein [Chloroflexi bacterium]|nr:VTT domain-containing protein [Chloroflexota bacterium]